MSKTALVTGGTGFVGSHLVDLLLERGWKVRCTVRRTSNLRWLEGKDIQRIEVDLRSAESLDSACKGVDIVFHVAGVIRASRYADFIAGNRTATANVVSAAVRGRVQRIVHVSSLAACGPSRTGQPVDESTPESPVSLYGRSKLEGEKAIRNWDQEIDITILRPPVVYGPRDEGMLQLFQVLAKGIELSFGGRKWLSLIHVSDLTRGILEAGLSRKTVGEHYFISNPEVFTYSEVILKIFQALERRRRIRLSLPDGLLRCLGSIADCLTNGGMFSLDKAVEITQKAWICSPRKAFGDFGFEAVVPLDRGFTETIRWYRENGLLP